ncbi:hypothetical protein WR25_05390 [Diploscapter pachys]|uniref:Uncharacterized protein n=1 Tax=Diploscapter pachys TaxID=2018661 RepID=A0A2A2K9Z3_9BILA|nr:hypothetical protein WR25_05390 [Diploscapter pachys]
MEVAFSPQAPIGIKKKVRISDELDIKFQDPTISSSTDSNSIPILFEDPFIKITECFLTIKDYFYPSALPVHIDFEKITSIKCEKQNESSSAKTWGIDNENDCWWAKDAFRNARTYSGGYNVIITCNGKHMGFTVFDIHDFIDILKPLLNDDVQVSQDS